MRPHGSDTVRADRTSKGVCTRSESECCSGNARVRQPRVAQHLEPPNLFVGRFSQELRRLLKTALAGLQNMAAIKAERIAAIERATESLRALRLASVATRETASN